LFFFIQPGGRSRIVWEKDTTEGQINEREDECKQYSRSEKRSANRDTTLDDEQPSPTGDPLRAIEITQDARSDETAEGICQ
jgi:hypothetical protein